MTSLSTGSGLALRPWTGTDAGAVREAFAAPLMDRQAGMPLPAGGMDEPTARQWIALARERRAQGTAFSWAVTDGDTVLGCAALGQVDRRHGTA